MPATFKTSNIKDTLHQELTCVDIKSLSPCLNLSGKYLQALVHHRYQHNKHPVPSLKLIVSDKTGNIIDLLAIGQVADDLDGCQKGDTLVCLSFEVEACPGHVKRPYQIVADDTEPVPSLIMVFKDRTTRSGTSSSEEQSSGTDKKSVRPTSENTCKILCELQDNTIVDVYGVVVTYKKIEKTRTADFYCIVSLMDPSIHNTGEKLTCNLFNQDSSKLPNLNIGDVVRFQRLKIHSYHGKKQGSNGPDFQWTIFNGSFADLETTSYTFKNMEKDKVCGLLDWWTKNAASISGSSNGMTFSQVKVNDYFDLVCQVIRVCDLEPKICKHVRVWDGTKFEGPLKQVMLEDLNETVRESETLMTASTDLAVDVYMFDNHAAAAADIINPGDYIKLNNLHAALVRGQVQMALHCGTSLNRGFEIISRDSDRTVQLASVLNALVQKCKDSRTKNNVTVINTNEEEQSTSTKVLKRKSRLVDISEAKSDTGSNLASPSKKSCTDHSHDHSGTTILNNSLLCAHNRKFTYLQQTLATVENAADNVNSSVKTAEVFSEEMNPGHVTYSEELQLGSISTASKSIFPVINAGQKEQSRKITSKLQFNEEISSEDSEESIWVSAYDDLNSELGIPITTNSIEMCPVNQRDDGCLQDDSISSSESLQDDLSQNEKSPIVVHSGNINLGSIVNCTGENPADEIRKENEEGLNHSFFAERFSATHRQETTDVRGRKNLTPLSLKTQMLVADEKQKTPLEFSQENISLLSSSILCFDSTQFSVSSQALNSSINTLVEENERISSSELLPVRPALTCVVHMHQTACNQSKQNYECNQVTRHADEGGSEDEQLPRCMLKTSSIVVGHPHVSLTKLKDVLKHDTPYKFRILTHVRDFHPRPSTATDLVHFVCLQCHFLSSASKVLPSPHMTQMEVVCPNCTDQPTQLQPSIIMTFLLSDGKYDILAYLWDKNATQFLNGFEPLQLLRSEDDFQQVQLWLDDLCPPDSALTDRPLLECCIFSHGVGQNVRYQIFDTVLVK